jgi:hypothetical protein
MPLVLSALVLQGSMGLRVLAKDQQSMMHFVRVVAGSEDEAWRQRLGIALPPPPFVVLLRGPGTQPEVRVHGVGLWVRGVGLARRTRRCDMSEPLAAGQGRAQEASHLHMAAATLNEPAADSIPTTLVMRHNPWQCGRGRAREAGHFQSPHVIMWHLPILSL